MFIGVVTASRLGEKSVKFANDLNPPSLKLPPPLGAMADKMTRQRPLVQAKCQRRNETGAFLAV